MKSKKLIEFALTIFFLLGFGYGLTPMLSADTSSNELFLTPVSKTVFPKVYNITAVPNDSSLGTVVGGEEYMDDGVEISLNAFPEESAVFEYWEDSCGNRYKDNPLVFRPTADETFTAYFKTNVSSIIAIIADGGSVTGSGSYKNGSTALLSFTPEKNYAFDYWEDSNGNRFTINPLNITVSENMTYTVFQKRNSFALIVEYNNSCGSVEGAGTYLYGTEYTLKATPNKGYEFSGWADNNDALQSNENPYSNTLTADTELKALFSPVLCDVNISAEHGSAFAILNTDVDFNDKFNFGEVVTLNAIPDDGYDFEYWMKDGKVFSYEQSTTYVVDIMNELTAVFKYNERPIIKLKSGDVNLDGVVDLLDDEILAKYVSDWDGISVDFSNADINKDGHISMVDSVILSRYIEGFPEYNVYFE